MHRKIIFAAFTPLLPLCLAAACANPKADYEDFVNRTNGVRGSDASVPDVQVDVSASDLDISGTWLGACLPKDIGSDPAYALIFYVDIKFTAEASGGKLDITFNPLKDDSTKMDLAQTCSPPFSAKGVTVSAGGAFDAVVGAITIDGTCQRIGASTLQLTDIVFKSRITSKDRFCAEIDGKLTSPFTIDLNPPGDYCAFARVKVGDDLPTIIANPEAGTKAVGFPVTEFHCP